MKILVMGSSRIGAMIVRELVQGGHDVTVMDTREENLRRIPPTLGATTLLGDGALEDDLRSAGIERMDAFFAVDQGDARNAFAAQKVRFLFKVPKVICLIYDPTRQQMYQELGVEAVSPSRTISAMLLEALRK
ncbi:MAG: TrkA family potassium uptake protein [Chloroflexi bacterium]|nr:TrkA family potassium uptake protein [Chloroflexota bacterium]